MMKSDAKIQSDVLAELEWEASVKHEQIGVAVTQGIVTLTGTVPSFIEKSSAEKAAQRIRGVKAVVEKIQVKLPGSFRRDDQDLAKAITNQIKWNSQIPEDKVKISVENGWVKLAGEMDRAYQKNAAEAVVRNIIGVKGLTNNIILKSKVNPSEIKNKIQEALKRAAELEAREIGIAVSGSRVVLSGAVRSFAELNDTKRAAWSAPGVTDVESHLSVAA